MTKKRMTKTEQFEIEIKKIASSGSPLSIQYDAMKLFVSTQNILKKAPKNPDRILWRMEIECIGERYRESAPVPESFLEYGTKLCAICDAFRDEWNYGMKDKEPNFIAEWDWMPYVGIEVKRLKKYFLEKRPKTARLDALMKASAMMAKTGITSDSVDSEIKQLTNNFDIQIIATIPCIEAMVSRRKLALNEFDYDPYGIYM